MKLNTDDVKLTLHDNANVDWAALTDAFGLRPIDKPLSLTPMGKATTGAISGEFDMRPVTEPMRIVGKLVTGVDVEIQGVQGIRKVEFWTAMDRRQARRVARKLGRTFRWKNGQPRWRER